MARNIAFASGEWYHCFNRGVDRRHIFMDETDYRRFQMLLAASNRKSPVHLSNLSTLKDATLSERIFGKSGTDRLVDIGAYALMPDRYHLLVRERRKGGMTSFMRRLGTAYTMYFNAKHERSGPLFSGTFKALHVEKDTCLRRVVNYIHGNPAELFEKDAGCSAIENARRLRIEVRGYEFGSLYDYEHASRPEGSILSSTLLEDELNESPSTDGVLEDYRTFYATSNWKLWS